MTSDLVTSVRVQTTPTHDLVTVWNRGGNAGTLTVQRHDGERVAARLLGDDAPVPLVVIEAPRGERTFHRAPTDGLEVFPGGAIAPKPAPDGGPPPRIGT